MFAVSLGKYYPLTPEHASYQVDGERSTCANLVSFHYASASNEKSPCSNVPILCPECIKSDKGSPAVWRYNMLQHICDKHAYVPENEYDASWRTNNAKLESMKELWMARHKKKQTRKSGKGTRELCISSAHSSRHVLTYVSHWLLLSCTNG